MSDDTCGYSWIDHGGATPERIAAHERLAVQDAHVVEELRLALDAAEQACVLMREALRRLESGER